MREAQEGEPERKISFKNTTRLRMMMWREVGDVLKWKVNLCYEVVSHLICSLSLSLSLMNYKYPKFSVQYNVIDKASSDQGF